MKTIEIKGIIGWDVDKDSVSSKLNAAKGEDVLILLDSPGGLVFQGISIFNIIRAYPGNVEIRVVGLAASAASYIALAGNKLSVLSNTVFMIHNPWLFAIGDHNDLRKSANHLESLSKILNKAYSKKSNLSADEIKSLMDSSTFLYGDEILEKGFADEVIEAEGNREEALAVAQLSIDNCLNILKEAEAEKEDFEKAVALISDPLQITRSNDTENNITAEPENENVNANSAPPVKNNSEENNLAVIKSQSEKIDSLIALADKYFNKYVNEIYSNHESIIDKAFFESHLDTLVSNHTILPAVKNIILNIVDVLNSSAPGEDNKSSVTESLFVKFETLIAAFPKVELLHTIATKPEGTNALPEEIFEFAQVDTNSRSLHQQAVAIKNKENISYLEAVKKILTKN